MCAPSASQYAAVEGLKDGFTDHFAVVESMREEYDKRRRFITNFFNETGLSCFEPRGAFYVYPSTENLGITGEEFANGLLRAEKVAYATSMANLDTATNRIAEYVRTLRRG